MSWNGTQHAIKYELCKFKNIYDSGTKIVNDIYSKTTQE
jgi:hypothetical protein